MILFPCHPSGLFDSCRAQQLSISCEFREPQGHLSFLRLVGLGVFDRLLLELPSPWNWTSPALLAYSLFPKVDFCLSVAHDRNSRIK